MAVVDKEYLRKRLWEVPYAYTDFVEGTIALTEKYGTQEQYNELLRVLKEKPEISYSEIVKMTQYRRINSTDNTK